MHNTAIIKSVSNDVGVTNDVDALKYVSFDNLDAARSWENRIMGDFGMTAVGGGLNRSAQHSNLVAKMECGHEAATSHLLFCSSAV